MVQNAIVKRVVSPGVVEVSLMRQLECGLSCKSCEGCPQKPKEEILALAVNEVGALPGNIVEVDSNVGGGISLAVLVYLLPCITLVLGYLVGDWLGLSEMVCVGTAFIGLFLGFVPALLLDRAFLRRKKPEFTILTIRG